MLNMILNLIFVIFCVSYVQSNLPEVSTKHGRVRGIYMQTYSGRNISAFLGIPYALPPINELRFKPPVASKGWSEILYADKKDIMCTHSQYFEDEVVVGTEDCLYLNVYTPELDDFQNSSLPVMVYIHGGGYMDGTGNTLLYGPQILLEKDIVLVTMNYRLGAFGFLSTGDEVVTGNMGLKDQHLALVWTKNNIEKFGGNSNKITIFGQSAGGASVNLQAVSPLNKGIITGAISQSGSLTDLWGIKDSKGALKNAKRLASFFECPVHHNENMIDCLRKVDASLIAEKDKTFKEWDLFPFFPYNPVIEPSNEDAFLSEDPRELVRSERSPDIPYVFGFVQNDGALFTPSFRGKQFQKEFIDNVDELLPVIFNLKGHKHRKQIIKDIRKFYFNNKKNEEITLEEIIEYKKNPAFLYKFNYRGVNTYTQCTDPNSTYSKEYGTVHCDELLYLFKCKLQPPPAEQDKYAFDLIPTLWTNFATTGKPTPELNSLIKSEWTPLNEKTYDYYYIRPSKASMQKHAFKERINIWEKVNFHYEQGLRDEL